MQTEKIVITGMGVVSPAGVGTAPLAAALREGRSCVRPLENIAPPEGCNAAATCSEFEPQTFLARKEAERLGRAGQLFFAAATLAIEQSRLLLRRDRCRIGIFEGTSLGGLPVALQAQKRYLRRGAHAVHPLTIVSAMTGSGSSMVSQLFHIHGPVMTCSNGSISSACAIAVALEYLQRGVIDVALAGGAEAPVYEEILVLFSRAGLLARADGSGVATCRPFDRDRSGTILGEGAAVLVLERLRDVSSVEVPVHAEIAGVAITSDSFNMVAPDPEGKQQVRAIREAMQAAGITAEQVDYVSLHGTGTRKNDPIETANVKRALGPQAYQIPMSSSKGMLGHTLGSCSAVELVKTLIAMNEGFVPPTVHLKEPAPDCDLDYVPGAARKAKIHTALVLNASFGGKNSALVVRKINK